MANVVAVWQSLVGNSATTAKFKVPPRFGASATANAEATVQSQVVVTATAKVRHIFNLPSYILW
jgi:hypothetical protein